MAYKIVRKKGDNNLIQKNFFVNESIFTRRV